MLRNHFTPYMITLTLFAAISGLLFGYDTGVIAGAILFLKKQFALNTFQLQIVVAIMLLGAAVGALFAGPLTDHFGRRKIIIGAALLFIIGAFTLALAQKLSHLIIGRIIVGLATGMSLIATPLYIAEIAPPKTRGFLVTCNQLFITIGILVAYISNYVFIHIQQGWRYMFGLAFIPALVQAISMLFFPETPRFLVLQHKGNKALKVLKRTRTEKTAQSELTKIQKDTKGRPVKVADLLSDKIKPAFIIAMALHIFQQITGINAIIYYAPTIFQMVGFSQAATAVLASVGIGVINVIMTFVAIYLLDRVGRKPLLDIGLAGMAFSMFAVAVSIYFQKIQGAHILSLIFTMAFVGFFAISMGPIPWLMAPEILPTKLRGKLMAVAACSNWVFNFIISATFLSLVEFFGFVITFSLFGFLSILALLFFHTAAPETKDKLLEDIKIPKLFSKEQ
jgi:sugar porter (SP) family MFS transporter